MLYQLHRFHRSLDRIVDIVTRLQARCSRNLGLIPGEGYRYFSSPKPSDWLRGLPSLPFSQDWWLFHCVWSVHGVMLSSNLHLMSRLRLELNFHCPICLMTCIVKLWGLLYLHTCRLWRTNWEDDYELERIWAEAVVFYSEVLSPTLALKDWGTVQKFGHYTRHVFKVRSGEPLKITHKR